MHHGPMVTSKKDALLLRVDQKKSELRRSGLRKKTLDFKKNRRIKKNKQIKKRGD